MADIDDGGSAFPNETFTASASGGGHRHLHGGMSLRDWFAGQALMGLTISMLDPHTASRIVGGAADRGRTPTAHAARISYDFADAMLAARKEGA